MIFNVVIQEKKVTTNAEISKADFKNTSFMLVDRTKLMIDIQIATMDGSIKSIEGAS